MLVCSICTPLWSLYGHYTTQGFYYLYNHREAASLCDCGISDCSAQLKQRSWTLMVHIVGPGASLQQIGILLPIQEERLYCGTLTWTIATAQSCLSPCLYDCTHATYPHIYESCIRGLQKSFTYYARSQSQRKF